MHGSLGGRDDSLQMVFLGAVLAWRWLCQGG